MISKEERRKVNNQWEPNAQKHFRQHDSVDHTHLLGDFFDGSELSRVKKEQEDSITQKAFKHFNLDFSKRYEMGKYERKRVLREYREAIQAEEDARNMFGDALAGL